MNVRPRARTRGHPHRTIRDSFDSLALSRSQYRIGSVELRSIKQTQLLLYGARTSRLPVQSDQLAQRINLYWALGGGFDLPPRAVATWQTGS